MDHKTKRPDDLFVASCPHPHSQSKSQPKPATGGKAAGTGRRGRRTTARRGGRASNRPKPKTTEELDAEMEDYYTTNENGAPAEGGNAAVNNGPAPAQQATNGGEDVGMAEISVSLGNHGTVQ